MPTEPRPLDDIAGVAERRIPQVKWGSILHFDPDEIDAWIERHRRPDRDVS